MYRQHFGITACPLDKGSTSLFDDGQIAQLNARFQWLLDAPGVGLLTGEAGVQRQRPCATEDRNPQSTSISGDLRGRHRLHHAVTCTVMLAIALGMEPAYRRMQLWRDIKESHCRSGR